MHGIHVPRAVLAAGEKMTGATVHLVTSQVDAGPIIAQGEVQVQDDDTPETLQARVQVIEPPLVVVSLREISRRAR